MNAASYTAGPWRVRTNRHRATSGEEWGWISANTDANIGLPGISRAEWQGEVGLANARLLASAPELLEALQETWRVIHAAGLHNLTNGVQLGPTVWFVKASDAEELSRAAAAKAGASLTEGAR